MTKFIDLIFNEKKRNKILIKFNNKKKFNIIQRKLNLYM